MNWGPDYSLQNVSDFVFCLQIGTKQIDWELLVKEWTVLVPDIIDLSKSP